MENTNQIKGLQRFLSLLTILTMVAGLFLFAPTSSAAAEVTFSPAPAEKYVESSGNYDVNIALTGYTEDLEVNFWIGKKGELLHLIDTHTFQSSGSKKFVWNGKLDGTDATPGKYGLQILGKNVSLSYDFEVVTKPHIDFTEKPAAEFTLGNNYPVSIIMTNFVEETNVELSILGPEGDQNAVWVVVASTPFTENGVRTITWDGRLNGQLVQPGKYQYAVQGTYGANYAKTNSEDGSVTILKAPEPPQQDQQCAGYKDIFSNHPDCEAIKWAKSEGIMTGQGNGDLFDPNGEFNRAQSTKVALEAHSKYNENVNYCTNGNPFPDVTDGWYKNYVCRAQATGVVTGYLDGPDAGKFVPGRAVSVIEMFAILLRPLENVNFVDGPSYTGLASNQWYSKYAKYSRDNGLYPGSSLSPSKVATRLEVAKFLYEMHVNGDL